jgi:PIN domain nuclease of toxin-antitoxin system
MPPIVEQLSPAARDLIAGGQHNNLVNAASAWEIAIQAHKGRLAALLLPGRELLSSRWRMTILRRCRSRSSMPAGQRSCQIHHLDPFDRLLFAQCQVEQEALLSADPLMARYRIQVNLQNIKE